MQILSALLAISLPGLLLAVAPYHDAQCGGKGVIVHLFEWKWKDIALECERYLGPKGFCGVQVSPPNEHCVITQNNDRPWWERYQPVSYKLVSRSGNEAEFKDMVTRCKKVGVRIYIDGVLNHMAGMGRFGKGSAGSYFNATGKDFPGVPFSYDDFHTRAECPSGSGNVDDYNDPKNVRNCNLVGLVDIHGGQEHVRQTQADFINNLTAMGVAGFRLDASKHMWPTDLSAIFAKVKDLPEGGRPFFYHEVVDYDNDAIRDPDYFFLGYVTEFRYSRKVKEGVDNLDQLKYVYDKGWGMSPPDQAFVFVDNHDTQRGNDVLTYKDGDKYKLAVAFTLAFNYGFTRIMSSYDFSQRDQGPPHNADFSTKSVVINPDGTCGNGWVCEHRWKAIGNMAKFRTAVIKTDDVSNWNANNQILSFSQGNLGFFMMGKQSFNENRQTGLPAGSYCDLISECKMKVNVDGSGNAQLSPADPKDPFIAIITQKVGNRTIPY